VLQCVAVRCSVSQRVVVYCSVLQCVAVRCSVLGLTNDTAELLMSSTVVAVLQYIAVCYGYKTKRLSCSRKHIAAAECYWSRIALKRVHKQKGTISSSILIYLPLSSSILKALYLALSSSIFLKPNTSCSASCMYSLMYV